MVNDVHLTCMIFIEIKNGRDTEKKIIGSICSIYDYITPNRIRGKLAEMVKDGWLKEVNSTIKFYKIEENINASICTWIDATKDLYEKGKRKQMYFQLKRLDNGEFL